MEVEKPNKRKQQIDNFKLRLDTLKLESQQLCFPNLIIKKEKNRLSGKITIYLMEEYQSVDVDEEINTWKILKTYSFLDLLDHLFFIYSLILEFGY